MKEIMINLKNKLLNETMTIKSMEEIVEDELNYDDDGKILNEKCADEDNTYCYGWEYYDENNIKQEFWVSINWNVVEMKNNLYDRVIKITDISLI